jgi:hypothetical protein
MTPLVAMQTARRHRAHVAFEPWVKEVLFGRGQAILSAASFQRMARPCCGAFCRLGPKAGLTAEM